MERAGSVEDARVTLVTITERGRDALDRVNRERNNVLGAHLERLSDDDVQCIRDGLGPLARLAGDVIRDQTTTDRHRRR